MVNENDIHKKMIEMMRQNNNSAGNTTKRTINESDVHRKMIEMMGGTKQTPAPVVTPTAPAQPIQTTQPKPTQTIQQPTEPIQTKPTQTTSSVTSNLPTAQTFTPPTRDGNVKPTIGPVDRPTVNLDYIKYLDKDTLKALDEGLPYESVIEQILMPQNNLEKNMMDSLNNKTFNANTGQSVQQFKDKIEAYNTPDKEDPQRVLYDYYKDWFAKVPKEERDASLKFIKDEDKKVNDFYIYGLRGKDGKAEIDRTGAKRASEAVSGLVSNASFGLLDKLEGDKNEYKGEARRDQSWYSAYNLGGMAGYAVPFGAAFKPVSQGLKMALPKAFVTTGLDSARKQAVKNAALMLATDTATSLGYSAIEQGADMAFDTRDDGAQTIGQRVEKVGVDLLMGFALGGLIEAPGLIKGIRRNRFNARTNEELDKLLSDTKSIDELQENLDRNIITVERLQLRRAVLEQQPESVYRTQALEKVDEDLTKYREQVNVLTEKADTLNKRMTQKSGNKPELTNEELRAYERIKQEYATNQREIDGLSRMTERTAVENARLRELQLRQKELEVQSNRMIEPKNASQVVRIRSTEEIEDMQAALVRELEETTKTQNLNNEKLNRETVTKEIEDINRQIRDNPDMDAGDVRKLEIRRENLTSRLRRMNARIQLSLQDVFKGLPTSGPEVAAQNRLLRQQELERRQQVEQSAREQEYADTFSPENMDAFEQSLPAREAEAQRLAEEQRLIEEQRIAEQQQIAEQQRLEAEARAEFPEYPDVPPTRDGRIEYVIDNVQDYIDNTVKKSEQIKADASKKLEELTVQKNELIEQKQEYLKNNQNIQRALAEYEEWAKLVRTVNALTIEGNGIKLKKGQSVPRAYKRGTVPIESVAERLGITVDELIRQMNVYQQMVSLSVKKISKINRKKRNLAIAKLAQEPEYQNILQQIRSVEEVIDAVNDINPSTFDFETRTIYTLRDPVGEDEQIASEVFGEDFYDVQKFGDSELFSGYLVDKWYPESSGGYLQIEQQVDRLNGVIDQQQKIIDDLIEDAERRAREIEEAKTEFGAGEDGLARMLLLWYKHTKTRIHLYDSDEDYYRRRKYNRHFWKKSHIPAWASHIVQLTPSKTFKKGSRQSESVDSFNEFVIENNGLYGMDIDLEKFVDNEWQALEAAFNGDPFVSSVSSRNILEDSLKEMGDQNPRIIIKKTQKQIEDLNEQLAKYTQNVHMNRLDMIAELPDSELANMIRDVKGEKPDFDELLNDYMNTMYPDRVVPDIEPIRLGPDGKPIEQPVPASTQAMPANVAETPVMPPATATDAIPAGTTEPAVIPRNPADEAVPVTEPAPAPRTEPTAEPVADTTVIPPAAEAVPAPRPEPPAEPVPAPRTDEPAEPMATPEEAMPEPAPRTPDEVPVPSIPRTEPINKPEFAEELRTDAESVEPPKPIDELPTGPARVERGFNETTRTSDGTNPQLKDDIEQQTLDNETASLVNNPNWYVPQSNRVLVERVQARIDREGMQPVTSWLLGLSRFKINDEAIATAQILAKRYAEAGDYGMALDIVNKVATQGTELGRAVQAFSLWNKLDKDGLILLAQRAISRRNQRNKDSWTRKLTGTSGKVDEIKQEDIQALMNIIENMPKIQEVNALSKQVQELVMSKKAGEELTEAELALLKQFQDGINELRGTLKEQPTPKETASIFQRMESTVKTREIIIKEYDAMIEEAKKVLRQAGFDINSNRFADPKVWSALRDIVVGYIARGVYKFPDVVLNLRRDYGIMQQNYRDWDSFINEVNAYVDGRGIKTGDGQTIPSVLRKRDFERHKNDFEAFVTKIDNFIGKRRIVVGDGQTVMKRMEAKASEQITIEDVAKQFGMTVDEFLKKTYVANHATKAEYQAFIDGVDSFIGKRSIVVNKSHKLNKRFSQIDEANQVSLDDVAKHLGMSVDDFLKKLNDRTNPLSIDEVAKNFGMTTDDFIARVNTFSGPRNMAPIDEWMRKLYRESVKKFRKDSGLPSQDRVERAVARMIAQKKITGEQAESLRQLATEASFYSDEMRVDIIGHIQLILNDIEGVSWARKVATFQTIAQLLNTKTTIRNLLGNELFWRLEQLNKLVAVPVDLVMSKLQGRERTLYFFTNNQESYWKNFMIGVKAGWKGYAPGGITSQYDLDTRVFRGKWNPMTYFEKMLGVTLRSFDYASYRRAYGSVVGEMATATARAEGLSGQALKDRVKQLAMNVDDTIHEIADQYGKYVTFQDENILSTSFVMAKRAMNLQKDFGAGDLILKYPKTPANLLMRAIDYSPIGIIRSVYTLYGKKDVRGFAEELARGVTGSAFTLLAFHFASVGILTGRIDSDKDINDLEKSAGVLPFSVNVSGLQRYLTTFDKEDAKRREGDVMMTYDWLQPMAVNMAIGTEIEKSFTEKFDGMQEVSLGYLEGMYEAAEGGATAFMGQPLISGVTKAFTQYPNQSFFDKLWEIGSGLPSSFVPTAVNQVRQINDNAKRLTYDRNPAMPMYNKVLDRFPFLSDKLPINYNALGKPTEKYQNDSNTPFNVFLNPSFTTRYEPNQEAKSALELYQRTGEKSVAPRVPNKSLRDFDGVTGKLTKEQYSELQKLIGEKQAALLKEYSKELNDPQYSDAEKAMFYQKLYDFANEQARIEFKQKNNYKAVPK